MNRLDKYWIGLLVGLLVPAIFGYIYIERMGLWYPLQTLGWHRLGSVLSKLTIVAIFPDMALLFLFYTTNTWRLAKGVLLGIFPYIISVLWLSL